MTKRHIYQPVAEVFLPKHTERTESHELNPQTFAVYQKSGEKPEKLNQQENQDMGQFCGVLKLDFFKPKKYPNRIKV